MGEKSQSIWNLMASFGYKEYVVFLCLEGIRPNFEERDVEMRFALAVLFLLTATSTFCADESKSLAMRKGAEVCVVLRVVDEQGNVVPDAEVYGGFAMGGGLNDGVTISGKTNRDGRFVVKGRCKLFVNLTVFKEGFYSWHDKFDYAATSLNPAVKDGKWQPYGETVVVTLKKKINPVEMPGVYGRGETRFRLWENGFLLISNVDNGFHLTDRASRMMSFCVSPIRFGLASILILNPRWKFLLRIIFMRVVM